MKHKDKHVTETHARLIPKKKLFIWQMISGVLLAVLIITLLLVAVKPSDDSQITGNVSLATVDQKVVNETISFLEEAFGLSDVTVKETIIEDGLYNITISLEGQDMPIYATLSGDNLIIPGMGLLNKEEALKQKEMEEQKEKELENISIADNYSINDKSNLEDFYGKPSVILFGGTYCGHCVAMVPEYKSKIWNEYNQTANIWVNVVDNKKFAVDGIAQGYNANLDYSSITGDDCGYVPSFIVLDKDGAVALKSCGSEKSVSDIVSKLNELLK